MGLVIRPRSAAALAAATILALGVWLKTAAVAAAVEGEALTFERRVKAAFLYKFAGYVEWPPQAFAGPDDPVVIAVVGADAVAAELEQVVPGRRIGGRSITVHRLSRGESPEGEQILFIGRDVERAQAFELLSRARGKPMLTVTEADSGWPTGSVINFVIVDDKVRFEISAAAAGRNGLRLGSQLLAVARLARTEPP